MNHPLHRARLAVLTAAVIACVGSFAASVRAADDATDAKTADQMKPYTETIPTQDKVKFQMTPIPGGTFTMGSPANEDHARDDEHPQVKVKVEPFWMGTHEVTWDEFDQFLRQYNIEKEKPFHKLAGEELADAVSIPTPQYEEGISIIVRMGRNGGYPAVDMSQLCARMYTKWLSKKTGHFYRLPTEAEWEYACRAGTTTPYSFGKDDSNIKDYAVYIDDSELDDGNGAYRKVGTKKPNPWGLYDMHGNVAEWVMDQYQADYYKKLAAMPQPVDAQKIINWPMHEYPCVVRGGSWNDFSDLCRSATRVGSTPDWSQKDPQIPQSIWWHTEAFWVGFRIVRPLTEPSKEEQRRFWEPADSYVKKLMLTQGDKQIRALISAK